MNRQNFLNALELQQQTTLDQNVKAQRLIKYQTLILDSDDALINGGNLAQVQLAHQAAFIDAFDKARTLETVNLDSGADDLAAQLVSLLKKRMHAPLIHRANEGNEEFCPPTAWRRKKKKNHLQLPKRSCQNLRVNFREKIISWEGLPEWRAAVRR